MYRRWRRWRLHLDIRQWRPVDDGAEFGCDYRRQAKRRVGTGGAVARHYTHSRLCAGTEPLRRRPQGLECGAGAGQFCRSVDLGRCHGRRTAPSGQWVGRHLCGYARVPAGIQQCDGPGIRRQRHRHLVAQAHGHRAVHAQCHLGHRGHQHLPGLVIGRHHFGHQCAAGLWRGGCHGARRCRRPDRLRQWGFGGV